ncbi:polysaccharide export protein EpsE [Caldimonas caldifontis]
MMMRRWLLSCLVLLGAWGLAQAQRAEHLLGPGDVVRIAVYQNPDLSLETRISELGEIAFPLIGSVNLAGRSTTSAQNEIARLLREGNFVNNPQVSVALMQVRSAQVSILGQVARPGRYPIETAGSKVSEMIAAAGGINPEGGNVVTLTGTRNGQPVKIEIDLPAVLQGGRADLDAPVANGDTLFVDRGPVFFIYGEVQRPGQFRLERGTTLMQALAQGGGLTQRGTERGMRVHRKDANGNVRVLQLNLTDLVERDDVIYVRESIF